jgi:3-oxoacyl-[acyl-carrier protein] reductase
VAITYAKTADAAAAVVKGIEKSGRKAIAIQADEFDAAAVKAAVDKTVAALGRLDILVNNAGIAIPKKFEETSIEDIEHVIAINVRGTMVATQAALKHLKKDGRIINIGSCVGERMMTPGLVAYSATKGAIKMFTQGLSREVGDRGITVNNVQPGPIDTELNPASGDWATPQLAVTALKRYGTVDEVAALVAFVASPDSSYITGANLTVDGGTNAWFSGVRCWATADGERELIYFRCLQFAGAGEQFFQLTFNGGVPDFFILHDSVGVDRECVRDGVDVEHSGDRAIEAVVEILRPGHVVLRDE